jgi:hypothetical protein
VEEIMTKHIAREPEDFELSRNQESVCPYCGYVCLDSWELFDCEDQDGAEAEHICGECEREYNVLLNVEYSFTTSKRELSK